MIAQFLRLRENWLIVQSAKLAIVRMNKGGEVMEIVLLVVCILLLCLCGVLCSRLYWATQLIDVLNKCFDKKEELLQAKDELLDKQREYIAVLEKASGIDFNEVEVK